MADNSFLFRRKPNKSIYKREYPDTIATTFSGNGMHQAVVLVKQGSGMYSPALFVDIQPTRGEALQLAHYINANYILRNNVDPVPMHLVAEDDTLAGLRAKGYGV